MVNLAKLLWKKTNSIRKYKTTVVVCRAGVVNKNSTKYSIDELRKAAESHTGKVMLSHNDQSLRNTKTREGVEK